MKIIRPIALTDAMLTASNVPETDYAAWSIGSPFLAGEHCIVVSTHKIYEALVNVTGGSSPEVDVLAAVPKWLEIGATNHTTRQPKCQNHAGTDETGFYGSRFSKRGILATQRCAEDALRVFTESLNIAHQSQNRLTRENRLQVAHDKLAELKKLENMCSFIHLENLQAVEASIAAVEAETRDLIKVQDAPSLLAGKQ